MPISTRSATCAGAARTRASLRRSRRGPSACKSGASVHQGDRGDPGVTRPRLTGATPADGGVLTPSAARTLGPVASPETSRARRRGDGRLTHDLDPQDRGPQDACGVFGVWAPGEDVAKLTYFGLYALQHRGQESAGIAVSNGRQILVYKDMGLVSQVFDETTLDS